MNGVSPEGLRVVFIERGGIPYIMGVLCGDHELKKVVDFNIKGREVKAQFVKSGKRAVWYRELVA